VRGFTSKNEFDFAWCRNPLWAGNAAPIFLTPTHVFR
jgi:hypothetical protein